MNDTHPEIERIFRSLMRKKTPQERVAMCFSMFESAKEIIRSSMGYPTDVKEMLFLRLYGNDFSVQVMEKILTALKAHH